MFRNAWLESICRVCMSKDNLNHIVNHISMLKTCAFINIKFNDELPQQICTNCLAQANNAYKFRMLCQRSDAAFRKYINDINRTKDTNVVLIPVTSTTAFAVTENVQKMVQFIDIRDQINDNTETNNATTRDVQQTIKTEPQPTPITIKTEISVESESEDDRLSNRNVAEPSVELTPKLEANEERDVTNTTAERKNDEGPKRKEHCEQCGKAFETKRKLQKHKIIHTGEHLCQKCGMIFTLHSNLTYHLKRHDNVRPHKCTTCENYFPTNSELKLHTVSHGTNKPHACDSCGKSYRRPNALRWHVKRTHGSSAKERPFACVLCAKSFPTNKDLKRHRLTHSGEKNFVCDVCSKAFHRACTLKEHDKVHTGLKPFVCAVCRRGFAQKHVLISHSKVHQTNGE